MSERELLWACIAFLERTSHEEAGDRLRLADKLRAALADRPEPMAIAHGNTVKRELWLEITSAGQHLQEGDKLYAAPVARPEPAQPVAWIRTLNGEIDWAEDCLGETEYGSHIDCYEKKDGYASLALYAAPPSHPAPSETLVQNCIKETGCEHPVACNATQRCALARLSAPSEAGAERQEPTA